MARNQGNTGNEPEDMTMYPVISLDGKFGDEKDGKHEGRFTVKVATLNNRPINGANVTLYGGEDGTTEIGKGFTAGRGIASFKSKVVPGEHQFRAKVEKDAETVFTNTLFEKVGEGEGGDGKVPADGDIEKELLSESTTKKKYRLVVTFPDKTGKGVKGEVLAFRKKGKDILITGTSPKLDADGKPVTVNSDPYKIEKGYCTVEATVKSRINKIEFQAAGWSKSKEVVLAGPKPVPTKASKANNRRWYALCIVTIAVFIGAMYLTFKLEAPVPESPKENIYMKLYGVAGPAELIAKRERELEKGASGHKLSTPTSKTVPETKTEPSTLKWKLWGSLPFLILAVLVYGVIAWREEFQNILDELELKILLAKSDKKTEAEIEETKKLESRAHWIHQWAKFVAKVVGVDLSVEAILGWLSNKKGA